MQLHKIVGGLLVALAAGVGLVAVAGSASADVRRDAAEARRELRTAATGSAALTPTAVRTDRDDLVADRLEARADRVDDAVAPTATTPVRTTASAPVRRPTARTQESLDLPGIDIDDSRFRRGGGSIDLPGIDVDDSRFRRDGGSIDLPGIDIDGSRFRRGGSVDVPGIQFEQGRLLRRGGSLDLPGIELEGSRFIRRGGGGLDLPGIDVEDSRRDVFRRRLFSRGPSLDLPGLKL